MDPNAITYFGETDARNKKIRFGIKAKDRLKHVYVIGKTGMGKSTLLENMAIQDIQNGNGMAFIDPHGGTAETLLDYVPESRIKDVLYFAPFDLEYPVAFNVMEDIGADKRHLVVNGLMSTFEKIWVDAWSARMAYILSNTLLALLEYPGATLLGVNRMLSDKEYRKKVVANITDTSVKTFWVEEFGKWTEKFIADAIPAIQNKVGQFTSNPLVRNLLGQSESTFNIRDIMDNKKILIINLSKGRVGEGNANLLGSMLITKIYLSAMSRADKNKSEIAKLPNFYLYVDEFQSFANKSFADILSEARKYNLNLTIAHQYIEQMEEEVRDAVFGNVGTMITFRVGAFDAEVLEKEFAPTFAAADLVNLGFAQIYLKLMIDGVSSSPFSATTMSPIAAPEINFKEAVIKSSREQFARPREIVEKEIVDWHTAGTSREVKPIVDTPPTPQNFQPRPQTDYNSKPSFQSEPRREPVRERQERFTPQNNTQNRREEYPRPQTSFKQEVSMDEAKKAFMKAAEELRQKESVSDNSHKFEKRDETKNNNVSLNNLKNEKDLLSQTGKKNPSKENLSSLKDALASVIKKPEHKEPVVKKEAEVKEKPHTVHKKEEPKTDIGEVPEDVLRNLLK